MRKIIYCLFFLTFLSQGSFSQEYKFDYYYEYNKDGNTQFFFINSKDSNYIFIGRAIHEGLFGHIVDYKTREFHFYELKNEANSVVFTYDKSCRVKGGNKVVKERKVQYEYSAMATDSIKTKITIEKNKINKGRHSLGKCELVYDNRDSIFHPHPGFFGQNFFDSRKLLVPPHKLPLYLRFEYADGSTSTTNLSNRKMVNAQLSLSKEQKKYK